MRYFVSAFTLLLTAPAFADNLCVNPNNANCFATIQGAVALANPGDTVKISSGVFNENVIVNTADLEIKGSSNTIVDPDNPLMGSAFTFMAADFVLRGFKIRNGQVDAVVVEAAATGGEIRNMWISGANGDCINNLADDLTVRNTTFWGCGSSAVESVGSDLVYRSNEARHIGDDGVEGVGVRGVVERSHFALVDNDAVDYVGDDFMLTNSQFHVIGDDFADIEGDDATLDRNRAEMSDGSNVDGANLTFINNRVQYTDDEAINWRCTACAAGGTVSNNRATQTEGDEGAYEFQGDVNGAMIDRNRAERIFDEAYETGSSTFNLTFENNRARDVGGDDGEPCYDFNGMNHVSHRNRAEDCHGPGFEIDADGWTSTRDQASWMEDSGFQVRNADGVSIDNARAKDANGAGFEVESGATNTTITNSRTSGSNGQEACDEGTGSTFTGNNFDPPDGTCRVVN